MFKDLLLETLESLTPEEKINVRDILDEKISATGEKKSEEGEPTMSKEIDNKKVETSINVDEKTNNNGVDKNSTETTKVDESTKVDETQKTNESSEKTKEPQKDGEENVDETIEKSAINQVQTTEETGNGVRIEDLVTKEELSERLSSLEAKFESVLKENGDLKNKLAEMQDKYENKDFGNFQRQGVAVKNKDANSSFDEYSKQFM